MAIVITIPPGSNVVHNTPHTWQYDTGQELEIHGLSDLPVSVPVHFAVSGASSSEARLGTYADGILTVAIPDVMFQATSFWAYVHPVDDDSGKTLCGIKFSLGARPAPSDTVTEDEQSAIDQLIAELNALIASVGDTNNAAADSAAAAAQSAAEAAEAAAEIKALHIVRDVIDITLTEAVAGYEVSLDGSGNALNLAEAWPSCSAPAAASSSDIRCQINDITEGYVNQTLASSGTAPALSVGLLNTGESFSQAHIECVNGDVGSSASYSAISSYLAASYNVRIGHLRGQSVTAITKMYFFSVPLLPAGTKIKIRGRDA